MNDGDGGRDRGRPGAGRNERRRERDWVERAADDFVAERRPAALPGTARERAIARVMVSLRAGRQEIPTPSADLARRVEAALAEARQAGPADPPDPPAIPGESADERPPAAGGPEPAGGVSRREVLRWAGVAAVVATLASIGVDRILGLVGTKPSPSGSLGWRRVASSADIADGGVLYREVEGRSIFLIRDAGRVRALSAVCTHMPCVLKLDSAAHEFRCPCHGAAFDLDGRSIASAYRAPLPSLPGIATRETGGHIYVWIG